MNSKKIKNQEELLEIVQAAQKKNQKVVSLNGCFDLLHPGHVYILYEAKMQGDILIVGLNSDASVRRLKGPDRPINNQETRSEMIAALLMVDYVFVFEEDDPRKFLLKFKPDVHVNDASYGEDCLEMESLRTYGGRLHLVEKADVPSTSQTISKIRNVSKDK